MKSKIRPEPGRIFLILMVHTSVSLFYSMSIDQLPKLRLRQPAHGPALGQHGVPQQSFHGFPAAFHDQLIKPELKIYVLLNKPKGYVTTSEDPNNRKTVMDLVRGACPERIYPVGRLDRNTTGVLLLTNDGEMASKLTHPKYLKKKIYHVWLDKNLKSEDAQRIAEGIMLDDGEIRADDIQYVNQSDRKQVGIEIHSGRNRIVRRMFEALGYHVIKLDRVFFAGLTKKNLKRGAWRFLTEEEVNFLRMGAYE